MFPAQITGCLLNLQQQYETLALEHAVDIAGFSGLAALRGRGVAVDQHTRSSTVRRARATRCSIAAAASGWAGFLVVNWGGGGGGGLPSGWSSSSAPLILEGVRLFQIGRAWFR